MYLCTLITVKPEFSRKAAYCDRLDLDINHFNGKCKWNGMYETEGCILQIAEHFVIKTE